MSESAICSGANLPHRMVLKNRTATPATLASPIKPPGKCLWCGGCLRFWQDLVDSNLNLYPSPVGYGRCESCGSLSQDPPLSPQQLGQAYPESYWVEDEDDSLLMKLALWYQQKVLAWDQGLFLRQVLDTVEGKRILEIGPPRGDLLVWARAQGAIVTGWERSCRAVSFLRSKRLEAESVILRGFFSMAQFGGDLGCNSWFSCTGALGGTRKGCGELAFPPCSREPANFPGAPDRFLAGQNFRTTVVRFGSATTRKRSHYKGAHSGTMHLLSWLVCFQP